MLTNHNKMDRCSVSAKGEQVPYANAGEQLHYDNSTPQHDIHHMDATRARQL